MYPAKPTSFPSRAAVRREVRYALRRSHPNHLFLTAILAGLLGVTTLPQFLLFGERARGWAKIVGGSTHGADFTQAEARQWVERLVHLLAEEFRLTHVMWFVHLSDSGRLDFHILFVMPDDNQKRSKATLWKRAKAVARRVAEEINEARLAAGRFTIGYLSVEGVVVYPLPRPVAKNAPALAATKAPQLAPVPQPAPSARPPADEPRLPPPPSVPAVATAPLPAEAAPPTPTSDAPPVGIAAPAVIAVAAPSLPPTEHPTGEDPPTPRASIAPVVTAPPPPAETSPAATHPVMTRDRDLAAIAAAARAADERRQAEARKEREEAEAKAKKRVEEEAYARFLGLLQRLQGIASEADTLGGKINARVKALYDTNLQSRIDDPELPGRLEKSRRWLGDAATQADLAATFVPRAGDNREMRHLKRTCSEAHDRARLACADLTATVTAVTAALETWRREIEAERRGPERSA